MWAALLSAQCSVHNGFRHTVHGIDGLETSMLKQAKTSDTKACMPDIDHIAGPVRDPPELGILTPKNEFDEFVSIDPVRPAHDGEGCEAGKYLARVRLGGRGEAEASIEILAGHDVLDGLLRIHAREEA